MSIQDSNGVSKQILGIETAPHLKDSMTTQKIMLIVCLALLPAFIVQYYFFGAGIIWQFINCTITAFVFETLTSVFRGRGYKICFNDYSYLVTAMILALTLPPLLPVYYSVVATAFAIIVVKSVFGGLGQNIFNPAMAAFVFIMIACPAVVGSSWIAPAANAQSVATISKTFEVVYEGGDKESLKNLVFSLNQTDNSNDSETDNLKSDLLEKFDALSGATYLEEAKSLRKAGNLNEMAPHEFTYGTYLAYAFLAAAYVLGGLVLIGFRIILIKMVLVFFASFIGLAATLNYLYPGYFMPVSDQLLFGGTMICAFFIMTDPVTNAGTSKGRIYFSILLAFLILMIRAFGSYSDAVAFAVMLSNACAPLIDVLTHRRSYGKNYLRGRGNE
ncbi:MAG: RnfABCDGE type electron transport complex subunit D [Succinivibrio sp.]